MIIHPDLGTIRKYALEMLTYDATTGIVTWKKQTPQNAKLVNNSHRGVNSRGYKQITLMGKSYLLHRIIFLMHYGDLPEFLDHLNHDRADNRLSNLRAATRTENARNRRPFRKKSGLPPGVTQKSVASFCARIRVNKRLITLGHYQSAEQAMAAYLEARINYFGDFCPT